MVISERSSRRENKTHLKSFHAQPQNVNPPYLLPINLLSFTVSSENLSIQYLPVENLVAQSSVNVIAGQMDGPQVLFVISGCSFYPRFIIFPQGAFLRK